MVLCYGSLSGGCGEPLGQYDVQAVRVTATAPLPADTIGAYRQFVEVTLRRKAGLPRRAADPRAIYVDADFCPLRNPNGLIAFGPFDGGGAPVALPFATKSQDEAGETFYRIYVPVAFQTRSAPRPGQTPLPTYDLRRAHRAICLRLVAPGYHLLPSHSCTITVSAPAIAEALRVGAAADHHPDG